MTKINTAVFSWAGLRELRYWESFVWCGSINWARRYFDNVVLVADASSLAILSKLELPFTEMHLLPSIPESILHVYSLPKLEAMALMARRNIPALHIDGSDIFLRKRLPERILNSPCVGEATFTPGPLIRELNSKLIPHPLDKVTQAINGGVIGGCDCGKILSICERSLAIARDLRNLEVLREYSGYYGASLFEEVSFGSSFSEDDIQTLLPNGTNIEQDHYSIGLVHARGGLKRNPAILNRMVMRVQQDWPDQYARHIKLFDKLY